MAESETWKHQGKGMLFIERSGASVLKIRGQREFQIEASDREAFESRCATKLQNPFRNGSCTKVKAKGEPEAKEPETAAATEPEPATGAATTPTELIETPEQVEALAAGEGETPDPEADGGQQPAADPDAGSPDGDQGGGDDDDTEYDAVDDEKMAELLEAHWKTMDAWLDRMESSSAVARFVEYAKEQEASPPRIKRIQDRLDELAPDRGKVKGTDILAGTDADRSPDALGGPAVTELAPPAES